MGGGKKERETETAPAAIPERLDRLSPREEAYLKTAKEIAVKFIETGRIGLAAFPEAFGQVYRGVKDAIENKG